jgi:4-amino-4-deoxy-L-arabinose transferase-like glycosyltransferase
LRQSGLARKSPRLQFAAVRPAASLPTLGASRNNEMLPRRAVWVAAMLVVLWALWAAVFNTAQFGDNIEQFNWAQSLELGYHKHPPLPTWLLGGVIKAFGPSVYWAYALAALCLLGTAAFTWGIGRELLGSRVGDRVGNPVGDRAAAAALLLWGLNQSFSPRAQLYNHNTVLVLCIAATVWCAMRATQAGPGRLRWWVATGLGAAAALLSKYQALVPLAGLLVALAWSGRLNKPAQRGGLALAIVTMLAGFAPHAVWMAQHDFSTLRYASSAIESSGLTQRFGFIVAFLANQVRLWFPALLALALYWVLARVAPQRALAAPDAVDARAFGRWMFGLVWFGVLALLVMALAAGVSLRNHWGVQVLQFFGLWLVYRFERRAPIDLRRLVWVVLAVHAASLAWYATEHRDPSRVLSTRRLDTMYPASRLAQTAAAHWAQTTHCPLRYVAGNAFDAGLVSLYAAAHPQFFDGETATPWIRPEDLQRRGALVVLDDNDAVPPGVDHIVGFDLVPGDRSGRPAKTLRLGVLMPQKPCV